MNFSSSADTLFGRSGYSRFHYGMGNDISPEPSREIREGESRD
jgi:hypothetical protein